MLNTMESAYDVITIKCGKTHDSYMGNLFQALKTFKNKIFVNFIICHKHPQKADASIDTPAKIDSFIMTAQTKYNNMKNRELWFIVEPADTKLLALTTQLASVEKKLAEACLPSLAPHTDAFLSDSKPPAQKKNVDTCCMQYVGPHLVLDGVACDWCDKGHKSAAFPNGIYMPEGHDHEEGLKKKLACCMKSSEASKLEGDELKKQAHFTPSSNPKSIKLTLLKQMRTCLKILASFFRCCHGIESSN